MENTTKTSNPSICQFSQTQSHKEVLAKLRQPRILSAVMRSSEVSSLQKALMHTIPNLWPQEDNVLRHALRSLLKYATLS